MKKTLEYIITHIVSDPDKVVIDESETDGVVNLTIRVADEDKGKVIGKEGKVIRAIRNTLKILAIKHHQKLQISLAE